MVFLQMSMGYWLEAVWTQQPRGVKSLLPYSQAKMEFGFGKQAGHTGGVSQPNLGGLSVPSSPFTFQRKSWAETGEAALHPAVPVRSASQNHRSRGDLDMPESPTELEATNSWISKTKISGHRPSQEPLHKILGHVQPRQDQEKQVFKKRRSNHSDSQGKGVK